MAKTTSPEVSLISSASAVVPDSDQHKATAVNSSSEDTDDKPLPVGGHEDNPSDSGTTSDEDDEETLNQLEVYMC